MEAVLEPEAEPLVSLVAAGGGSIEGLRLDDGGLVLKVGYPAVRPIMSAMREICSPDSTADEQAARPSRSMFR